MKADCGRCGKPFTLRRAVVDWITAHCPQWATDPWFCDPCITAMRL